MKVIRVITYESDDADALQEQLGRSLADGEVRRGVRDKVTITCQTISDEELKAELKRRGWKFA